MRILVEVTDREMLDLDMAVTERRIKLREQLMAVHAAELAFVKQGDVTGMKSLRSDAKKLQDELNSLDSIMDKLYTELNRALGGD